LKHELGININYKTLYQIVRRIIIKKSVKSKPHDVDVFMNLSHNHKSSESIS